MAERKSLSKKVRFEVFKRDSFTCQYCGESAPKVVLNVDHINPVSKSGENDFLNLITSCFDCNAGKKDRLLSDNSAISRQKNQLDELNLRREQLEMMLEWREGLKEISQTELQAAADEWAKSVKGYHLNDTGLINVQRLIDKFGLEAVLKAIREVKTYLEENESGEWTAESVETAFSKIGSVCRVNQQPDWMKELYYIRGIIRNRINLYNNQNQITLMEWLIEAYESGVSIQRLRAIAYDANGWTSLRNKLFKAIDEAQD